MKKITLFLLSFYKKGISPVMVLFLGHGCRFTPTCSDYSQQAIEKYGFLKGFFLSFKRILRCNPFTKPGYDPLL